MKRSALVLLALPLGTVALVRGGAPASAATADEQIAQAGVIVDTDMPGTWTSAPQDRAWAKRTLALAKRTKGCARFVKFDVANRAATRAESAAYQSSAADLSNEVSVHKSPEAAAELMTALADPSVAGCLQAVLQTKTVLQIVKDRDLRKQVENVDLTLEQTELGNIGTDQVAFEGLLTIDLKDGTRQQLNVGLVAVQVEQAIITYSVSGTPDSTDVQDVFAHAVANTVRRTSAAL